MNVTVDLWPCPLTADGRETVRADFTPGATLATVVRAAVDTDPDTVAPVLAADLDGRTVPPAQWDRTAVAGGAIVRLRARAAGGGGGDKSGAQVLFNIAIIAASIAVPGASAFAAWSPFARGVLAAAITLGGRVIGNALFPPRAPVEPAPTRAAGEQQFSIQAGRNRGRPQEPVLLVLGRHRIFPDLIAAPYLEFNDGDQFLALVVSAGAGDVVLTDLAFGGTPLSQIENVAQQWRAASDATPFTIVASDVDSVAGADLDDDEWVTRRTSRNIQQVWIDLTAQLARLGDDGEIETQVVRIAVRWRVVTDGTPGAWSNPVEHVLANASHTPLRASLPVAVGARAAAEQVDVGVRRTTDPSDDSRVRDSVSWLQLRTHQGGAGASRGITRLALRLRASGQLQGDLDRLSGIATQRVPVWAAGAWTAGRFPSSNPAAIFRWLARGVWDDGALVAGAGLADARIDHAGLGRWFTWCETNGLTCDMVVDRPLSRGELLAIVAQCGRASLSWGTGKLGVLWADPADMPTAMVTPGNIVAGSCAVQWADSGLADEIVGQWTSPDLDWQTATVRRATGTGAPTKSLALALRGVTQRAQAVAEVNLAAARQIWHRRTISWRMSAEGLAIGRGDVVLINHALLDGGVTGRCRQIALDRLVLDREVGLGVAGDTIVLRLPEGGLHTSAVAAVAGAADEVTLTVPLPALPGGSPSDVLWRLYASSRPPLRARIVGVEPQSSGEFAFEAIDEAQAYYDAADLALDEPIPAPRGRTPRVVAVVITEDLVLAGRGRVVELTATLSVAGDWRGGVVRVRALDGNWRTVAILGPGEDAASWVSARSVTIEIQVIPGSAAAPAGPIFTRQYTITGDVTKPIGPSNFLLDILPDETRRFRWGASPDPSVVGYLIRYALDSGSAVAWESMWPMHEGVLGSSPFEQFEPGSGTWRFALRAITAGRVLSADTQRISATLSTRREGAVFFYRVPSSEDWPALDAEPYQGAGGVHGNLWRSDDAANAIEGAGAYQWGSAPASWGAWTSWGAGDGAMGWRFGGYSLPAHDLDRVLPFRIRSLASISGAANHFVAYKAGDSRALMRAAAWRVDTGALIKARWIALALVAWAPGAIPAPSPNTGDATAVLRIDHWEIRLTGTGRRWEILDAGSSDWTRDSIVENGVTLYGRQVPVPAGTFSVVTSVAVTIQGKPAGWTWSLLRKSTVPLIGIWDASGQENSAIIDVVVHGI